MIETKNKDIRGNNFAVTQLAFKKSREVFARLTKIFGAALGSLAGGAMSGAKGGAGLESSVGAAIEALCSQVSEQDLEYLCDTFADTTTVKLAGGTRSALTADLQEVVFGGRLEDCFAWLAFCLEVNYSGFFDVLKAALPVKAAPAAA